MTRRIIKIDGNKCNGCGICAVACHEGAIEIIDGRATLTREDYCDGLGDCLPACPTGAITFEEREAPAYDEEAVLQAKTARAKKAAAAPTPCASASPSVIASLCAASAPSATPIASQLTQWPVQIKLAPLTAPYFDQANLLIAADCTAYAYGDFHNQFIRNRITLIGCPKLDDVDYTEKLSAIIANNDLKSVTVVRMEVPCCGGIARAVQEAVARSHKDIPLQIITLSIDGKILGGH